MTTEQDKAYKSWWFGCSSSERNCIGIAGAFDAGWDAARANRRLDVGAIEAEARAEIERKLLVMAGQAFVAGKDDHAHWFRSLVNVLFKAPGETSA